MRRHWQHRAITKEVVLQAEYFNGLKDTHTKFLQWLRTRTYPVGRSIVVRDFFQKEVRDSRAQEDARILLETLAINGYLIRSRHHAPPRTGISHILQNRLPKNEDLVITQYRLSMKSKHILGQHGSNSSTRNPTP